MTDQKLVATMTPLLGTAEPQLYVTDFENGSLQQWRLVDGALEFTGLSVGVARGAHAVAATR